MSMVKQVTISEAQAGQRLDNYLISQLKGVPKSRVYKLLRTGQVRVNKGRVKAAYRLKADDIVRIPPVRMAEKVEHFVSDTLRDTLNAAVIYEDDTLIALNKPAGLAVHGGSGVPIGVIEALRVIRPECQFLDLVHRLDRETSGCLLIAKKRSMLTYLHALIREHKIEKRYQAIVKGHWSKRRSKVDLPLKKVTLPHGETRVVVDAAEGKPSLSYFKVLNAYQDSTLVEIDLHTGRTHQIRVHAAACGHPIVGDEKYGDTGGHQQLDRLCLHAYHLSFLQPDGTTRVTITCRANFNA